MTTATPYRRASMAFGVAGYSSRNASSTVPYLGRGLLGIALALNAIMRRQQREGQEVGLTIGEKITPTGLGHWFTRRASAVATRAGSPWAFLAAATSIVIWAFTGPFFGFSTDWSLAVNTMTTIVTFLMVFVIQNTQNRDAKAMHLKLDELLRATPRARNEFMEAEEEDLDEIVREKAIVDKDDPAPPADMKHEAARTLQRIPRSQPGERRSRNGRHPDAG